MEFEIITKRPEDMTYERYRELRIYQNKIIKKARQGRLPTQLVWDVSKMGTLNSNEYKIREDEESEND